MGLAYFGAMSPKSWRSMWECLRHFTALTNYWFKRKTYRYLTSLGPDKGLPVSSIIKRCSVAAVLALAALVPDFRLLNTSPEGWH